MIVDLDVQQKNVQLREKVKDTYEPMAAVFKFDPGAWNS